jgi:hypothetical protein
VSLSALFHFLCGAALMKVELTKMEVGLWVSIGSGNDSRLMFSGEIVSCYKNPAELVLFHDVKM